MSNPGAINKLADELWLHIFKFSTEASLLGWSRFLPSSSRSLVSTPFTLAAVSRSWRAVCLTNNSVWDTAYLRFPAYEIQDDDDYSLAVTDKFIACVDALQLWMERAGERSVSVALDLQERHMSVDFAHDVAMRIPHIVVEHAKQIKDLDMVLSAEWFPIFNGVHFPILSKLKLFVPEIWPADGTFDSEITELSSAGADLDLTACPRLWSVETDGSYRDHSKITLPWAQIREVHVGWVRPLVYPEILDLMPNVRRCTLDADAMYWPDIDFVEADASEFEMMERRQGEWALEDLKVSQMDPIVIKALLDHSPLSLKRIFLAPSERSDHLEDSVLLQALTPFSATLNSLAIRGHWLQDFDALVDALLQLKSLVALEVYIGTEDRGLDDDFLSKTLCKPDVLPCLENLSIRTTKLQFSGGVLELGLANRGHPKHSSRPKCAIVQELKLTGTDPNQPADPLAPEKRALFEGYVENGLQLTIGHMQHDPNYHKGPFFPRD